MPSPLDTESTGLGGGLGWAIRASDFSLLQTFVCFFAQYNKLFSSSAQATAKLSWAEVCIIISLQQAGQTSLQAKNA